MLRYIDFAQLVGNVGSWSDENFGDQPASFPLIGAGEELGELTRSVLKRAQGIDDSEKYETRDDVGEEAERDAVADVAIYLSDFAYRSHLEIEETYEDYEWYENPTEDPVDSVLQMYVSLGGVVQMHLLGDRIGAELEAIELLMELERFCELRDYDPAACIDDAWNGEVVHREWDASVAE